MTGLIPSGSFVSLQDEPATGSGSVVGVRQTRFSAQHLHTGATLVTMFHHLALFRFTPESTTDQHRAAAEGLCALVPTIQEIRSYDVRVDAGLSPDNAHMSLHATFDDEAAWRAYSAHPDHIRVVDGRIKPILAAALRTQYTDDAKAGRP
jgi:hypothetical protein